MQLPEITGVAVISALCIVVAVCGVVAVGLEIAAVRAFVHRRSIRFCALDALPPAALTPRGATILKPLAGAEPGLADNLASFAVQDHAGPLQIVCAVADRDDPAAAEVRALQARFPALDIALVVTGAPAGGNAKIANLAGATAAIAHGIVVLSDSDIRVAPSYLRHTIAQLGEWNAGLVTWLYRGEPTGGLWSLLAAMAIDDHFFPSVLLGLRVGRARPCVGATMAFTRETLAAIGGFAAFREHLADDHAMGEAVRRLGQRVVVAAEVVEHRCGERTLGQLAAHELRWARTIRAVDPRGYVGSVVMHPLPFALAAALLRGFDAIGAATLVAVLLARLLLQWHTAQALRPERGLSAARAALGPVRDMLSFVVFCSGLAANTVVWRGRRYRVRADGTMAEVQ